ncbi:uncharacterized membrane protein YuzA (DUF378 family) [Virgibacillus natechei]|uniref:Uncharacterized membrane protein YuzA (DUF378 family) n=1 Tax=Virgibacillus natechei TaxID=1216297 RepID=A0ABS4IK84_9BACI|nr:DUF378 domain-containing protein [Virgibacillus natechei]MBP1970970.1 uncharacterized membrane protein YuzA (DUF378 family) [Virgibacillus natechei]UZD12738.1 DUF378 domain-containing protein [Virgibacillus natechei]
MRTVQRIALALLIIGGINWGLIGLFQWDLVASLFGGQEAALSRVVYTLVGISALFCLTLLFEPMDETEHGNDRGRESRKLNYGTEFSDETDASNLNDSSRDFPEKDRDL